MVEIVWEFNIKDHNLGHFELIFGPGGAWSNLFGSCSGFRGATVLRDTSEKKRYLLVEVWDTEDKRKTCQDESGALYNALWTTLKQYSESIAEMGSFRVLTQAGVRPMRNRRRRR